MADLTKPKKQISIWWFAFGYFAVYVPYSFFTKVLTKKLWADPNGADQVLANNCDYISGLDKNNPDVLGVLNPCSPWYVSSGEILPPTIMASICVMLCFISCMRWWKYATQWKLGSLSLPRPRIWTLLSGICTGFVVVTTTLAYTIDGVSIVFAMLFMRGGMLIMSPIVDTIFKRHVRWFSWAALGMSLAALIITNVWPGGFNCPEEAKPLMNGMLAVDLIVYLASYFCRLSFMSKLAKSENDDDTKKFFVEEQMVGTPSVLIILFIASFFAPATINPAELGYNPGGFEKLLFGIHTGFFDFWTIHNTQVILTAMCIGFFSQFNGVFGGLILLDKSENAFAVPVNRCSSILAGVTATCALAIFFPAVTKTLTETCLDGTSGEIVKVLEGYALPSTGEFVGAAFVVGAICFLTIPKMLQKMKAKKNAATAGDIKADEPKEEKKEEEKKEEVKAEDMAEEKKEEAKSEEAKPEENKE